MLSLPAAAGGMKHDPRTAGFIRGRTVARRNRSGRRSVGGFGGVGDPRRTVLLGALGQDFERDGGQHA